MDLKGIFDILGIEITKSELVIKRAYQERVKEVHPEERPIEWQKLHQAYKDALSYAKGYLWFLDEFNDEIEVLDKEDNQERPVDSDGGNDKEFYGDLEGNIEQEIDEGRDEEDVYHSLFTDLYVSGEKTRQENMTQVMKYFESIVNAYPGSHDWQLIDFLKSPLFRSCWEEELVLFYLKRALEQVKNPKIASQISEVLEEMIEHLTGTMETSKVNQIKEMLASNRKKEPTSIKDKWLRWRQKPKVVTGAVIIGFFIAIISISIGSNPGNHTNRFILSETEARELMIAHLEDKYGFAGLDSEELTLKWHGLYWMDPPMQVGFRGEIGKGNIGDLILIAWEEEGQAITYVFDNFQLRQINYDLGTVLLQELGLLEGEAFLSSAQSIFSLSQRYIFNPSWAGFHAHYDGDLQQFFEEEAKIRNRINYGVFTNEVAVNPNGRVTLYIRDSEIGTMSDRLRNRDVSHLKALEEVLATKAEIYQIQILALVLPQSYYDEVIQSTTVDEYLRNNTLNAIRSLSPTEGTAPILPPLLTGWYHSKDERFSSQLFMIEATEITDGVFVIKQSTQARLGLGPITVERSESIDEVEEYLRSSGVLFTNSVNLSISGPSYEGYILLDVEKVGIPATNYTIANVSFNQDGEIRQITQLDISTTIRENFEELGNVAIVDGYLIIPPGARFVTERMITIVYW